MQALNVALFLIFLFQIKHLIADFLLQSRYILDNRRHFGHPGGLLHVTFHALGTLVVLLPFGFGVGIIAAVVLAEAVFHYHLDWLKDNIVARWKLTTGSSAFWILLGADQALHQMSYLVIVWVLLGRTAAG